VDANSIKKPDASKDRKKTPKPKYELQPLEECDDDLWQLVTNKKPSVPKAVFYVGKICKTINEEKLKKYILWRSAQASQTVNVHSCTVFQNEESEFACARVIVDKVNGPVITSKKFWAKPSYIRDWKFDKYKEEDQRDAGQGSLSQNSGVEED